MILGREIISKGLNAMIAGIIMFIADLLLIQAYILYALHVNTFFFPFNLLCISTYFCFQRLLKQLTVLTDNLLVLFNLVFKNILFHAKLLT